MLPRRGPSALRDPRTSFALVACAATAGVAGLADAAREHDGVSRLDPVTAADVLTWRTPALTHLARILTFMGSEIVVGGLAIAVLLTLLTRHQLTRATVFATAMGGSAFLTVAVKLLVGRPRPGAVDRLGVVDTTYSFPSGHTLNSAVFLALVVWLLWPSVRYAGHVALVTVGRRARRRCGREPPLSRLPLAHRRPGLRAGRHRVALRRVAPRSDDHEDRLGPRGTHPRQLTRTKSDAW